MIEVQDYRTAERTARSVIKSWWLAETHIVDHFAKVGFPVRIDSIHEVGQLLDTMQENRYQRFLAELGGLTTDECRILVQALAKAVRFQLAHLPKRAPIVPISTMTSSLALYKKIIGFKPEVQSVLEVGPGCGYLSFFLHDHQSLGDYSQVEACESFYILQSLVNSFLFAEEFQDLVLEPCEDRTIALRPDVELPIMLDRSSLCPTRCHHYPWWTLNELYNGPKRFDVITSNANLNEFSANALRDYLTIFGHSLKDDGVFLVQCTGFPAHGNLDSLFDRLYEYGFAPLFCGLADDNVTEPLRTSVAPRYIELGFDKKSFALNNLLMVKEGHPLYHSTYDRTNYRHGFASSFGRLDAIFLTRRDGMHYTREELTQQVISELLYPKNLRDGFTVSEQSPASKAAE